jgi:hypothetical protein
VVERLEAFYDRLLTQAHGAGAASVVAAHATR